MKKRHHLLREMHGWVPDFGNLARRAEPLRSKPTCIEPMNALGTINEILNHKGTAVYCISPDATVFDAIQKMADKNVGALLVMDGDKLIGIVSETVTIPARLQLRVSRTKQTSVREIITGNVIQVSPSHTVEDCMRLMTEHRVRHLPVVYEEQVLGVISIGDLVNWTIYRAEHNDCSIEHLYCRISRMTLSELPGLNEAGLFVNLTETYRAWGMGNFLTSTSTV